MNINLERLGAVSRNVGSARFGQALFSLFDDLFDIKVCTVFAFAPGCEPRVIVSEGATPSDRESACKLAAQYAKGRYQDDPEFTRHSATGGKLAYRLRAEDLGDTPYRRRFFDEPGIGYQLVQLATLDDVLYSVSVGRARRTGPFYARDILTLRRLGRFTIPSVERHVCLLDVGSPPGATQFIDAAPPGIAACDAPTMRDHMRQVFLETPHRLSPREAEVCAGIVLGHSTIAIGLNLQIAYNTVATHRKRAYKKLGVTSQSELFARYFENVRGSRSVARHMPLVRDASLTA